MAKKQKSPRRPLARFFRSVWFFPALLAVVLVILTALHISGSSIGLYHQVLYGSQKDPNLLLNQPQTVRSDEWLVTTQLTIAQKVAGYPRVNPNIDGGRDMSVIGDAPYKDWSAVFKPQNWAFFILPLGYAFAFKWWLLLFLVIVSCYFFVLKFFSGRRLLAALIGGAVGCSPFLFWWYQTGTLAPIFYGFFIILVGMRIIDGDKVILLRKRRMIWSHVMYAAALVYLLTAFALILYPPFQIPVALAVAAFLAGYLLEKQGWKRLLAKSSLKKMGVFLASLLICGGIVLSFVHTRAGVVDSINNSAYPSHRNVDAGGEPIYKILGTYLQPQLERKDRGTHYYDNQSESSNFILLLPFLLAPGFFALYLEKRQGKPFGWSLLLLQLLALVFLGDLFWSFLQPVSRILFLTKVEHARLYIGLGFIGFLQFVLLARSLSNLELRRKTLYVAAAVYSIACFGVLAWVGATIQQQWPLFIGNKLLVGGYGLAFTAIIFLLLSRRYVLSAALLFVYSFLSIQAIHPIQRGLEPLYPSKLSAAIDSVSKPGDSWATLDDIYFENAASMANRKSLSGIQPYPNTGLWSQADGPGASYIYNRYAHVLFSSSGKPSQLLSLATQDNFHVVFACTPFDERHLQFVLAVHPIYKSCAHLAGIVNYPSRTFYLYRIKSQI